MKILDVTGRAPIAEALALLVAAQLGCGGGASQSSGDADGAADPVGDALLDDALADTAPDAPDGGDPREGAPADTGFAEVAADAAAELDGAMDRDDSGAPADTVDTADTADTPDVSGALDGLDPPDSDPPDAGPEVEVIDASDDAGPVGVGDLSDASDADGLGEVQTPPCPSFVATHPIAPSPYVPVCSVVDYATDPPTSGPHYPVWATYKTYLDPVSPGFLVHSLKHGAIVITWSCPEGCAAELTALREMLRVRPLDPRCDPLVQHRIIVAPRPGQNTRVAAAAWGASWKADCFELASLSRFIDEHYGQGLEDHCFEGVDVEKIRPDDPWYCPP